MLVVGLLIGLGACVPEPARPPPSFLLVVLDTTRVDAVSAYGNNNAMGTITPATDRLAADGIRYTRAYAQAPWTLPSHATLFTGLIPSRHGVGWRRTYAPDTLVTLAEALRDAGYETVGVSENPWISLAFNMVQGFERFTVTTGFTVEPEAPETSAQSHETVLAVAAWLRERRGQRPFLLFVNLLDAHVPYRIRAENPFLPRGVGRGEARGVSQVPGDYLCRADTPARALAILRGLYLGGVAAADAKLAALRAQLHSAGIDGNLVTIVTSDHGEHFGEHRMVGHQFSVRDQLLHVPLVVHGLRDVAPAVIDTPVALTDVMPTVLQSAGVRMPEGLAGRPLPVIPGASRTTSAIIAEHDDSDDDHTPQEPEIARLIREGNRAARRGCTSDDRVFGEMRALVRYPLKLVWYARYPAELYDLSSDPEEQRDLAPMRPSAVAVLTAELGRMAESRGGGRPAPGGRSEGSTAPEIRARLRALGYLGDTPDPDERSSPGR